jgi:hypothetical protein
VLTRGVKLISLTTACQTTEFSVTAADNKLFVQFQGNTTTLLFIILNCVITFWCIGKAYFEDGGNKEESTKEVKD